MVTFDDLESKAEEYAIDPLTLAVALKRSKKSYGLKSATELVIPEDYSAADQIRNHYSKKFFWLSLTKPDRVSEFRKKTLALLQIKSHWTITEPEAGIFVKLPYFYEEDQFYDSLKLRYVADRNTYINQKKSLGENLTLTFIGKTFKWQRVKVHAFWFASQNNFIYGLLVPENTPFLDLFEEKIKQPITIENNTGIACLEDMYYNKISNIKFIKELYAASSPNSH